MKKKISILIVLLVLVVIAAIVLYNSIFSHVEYGPSSGETEIINEFVEPNQTELEKENIDDSSTKEENYSEEESDETAVYVDIDNSVPITSEDKSTNETVIIPLK